MFDRLTIPGVLAAGHELARSALPDARVVRPAAPRERRRPRLRRPKKEDPCAT